MTLFELMKLLMALGSFGKLNDWKKLGFIEVMCRKGHILEIEVGFSYST